MANHARQQILDTVVYTFQLIDGTGSYINDLSSSLQIRTGKVAKESINVFPTVIVADTMERYEDAPHPLYTRFLTIDGEALIKYETGDPDQALKDLLADLERAAGANPTLQTDIAVPSTRLAVEWRFLQSLVMRDFPAQPYATLVFSLEVHYRTLRADPTAIR